MVSDRSGANKYTTKQRQPHSSLKKKRHPIMAKNTSKKQQFLSPENYLRQKARQLPIGKCYISSNIRTIGEGMVIVQRLHTGGKITFGAFLIDTFCLGLLDAYVKVRVEEDEFNYNFSDRIDSEEFIEITYAEAHNWIYGAIAWAEEAGIEEPRKFNLPSYVLEEDTDDIPLIELPFGKDGKHFLVASDIEMANRMLPSIEAALGEKIDFTVTDSMFEDE